MPAVTPLPLSVIGGYLGAGKTTLINKLLTATHGMRLGVLVNDFGQINIDAALLKSADRDTIELTNGCVCCTMSGDLFYAIGDMLDRTPRPDHLIVEASGIADPAKIAQVALAEPDLRYAGILTVADGLNLPDFLTHAMIADQLHQQIACADLVAVSKTAPDGPAIKGALKKSGVTSWVSAEDLSFITAFLFDRDDDPKALRTAGGDHPAYIHWSDQNPDRLRRSDIDRLLASVPDGVLRIKGLVPGPPGEVWEIHVVGRSRSLARRPDTGAKGIVALGLAGGVTATQIADWWSRCAARTQPG